MKIAPHVVEQSYVCYLPQSVANNRHPIKDKQMPNIIPSGKHLITTHNRTFHPSYQDAIITHVATSILTHYLTGWSRIALFTNRLCESKRP
jgi:hypothetical protein